MKFLQPTARAIRTTIYMCPCFLWAHSEKLAHIGEYYERYGLLLRWDSRMRTVVVDPSNHILPGHRA